MVRSILWVLSLAIAGLTLGQPAIAQEGRYGKVKVVMHGDGVGILKSAKDNLKLQGEIANLKSTHKVAFLVCNNTLTQRKIDPDKDLFEVFKEDIVPSGVAELSLLQSKGYTYIKP
ncbi:MAG: DsrE family protein [Pseudomonadota bacterium]